MPSTAAPLPETTVPGDPTGLSRRTFIGAAATGVGTAAFGGLVAGASPARAVTTT
ncbi:twin-arginine translocation signal domain-containing protein, partial [Frankia sp. CcI49]